MCNKKRRGLRHGVNENFFHSLLSLGNTYLDEGKYKKALDIFEQYLEKATDRASKATGYAQIALTHWRLGEIDKAIANYKESLEYLNNPYRGMVWLNEAYLYANDSTGALQSLKQNYDSIKESIQTQPTLITSLANLSLWYDVNVDETIDILNQTVRETDNRVAQMWGRFYLALLHLKTNQWKKQKKLSGDFTREFIEILKDLRDIRYDYYTWKGCLIFNQCAVQFADEGIKEYHQLIRFCVDNAWNMPEMILRSFLADLYFQIGDGEKAKDQLRIAGVPEEKKWMVIGPFDNTSGFHKKYPPEDKIELNKAYNDHSRTITWQHPDDGFQEGYMNFKQIYAKYNWSVAYGLIYANCPDAKDVQFRIGTNEAVKVWLNDQEVWKFNIVRDSVFDDDIIHVSLKPGLNKILIKVCNRVGEWGFYFRITDKEGNGVPDIQFVSPNIRA